MGKMGEGWGRGGMTWKVCWGWEGGRVDRMALLMWLWWDWICLFRGADLL